MKLSNKTKDLKLSTRLKTVRLRIYHLFNRTTILFVTGLLGTAHETLLEHAERPTLLIMFAAMMGLPAFLNPGDGGNEIEDLIRRQTTPKKKSEPAPEPKEDSPKEEEPPRQS